MDIDLEISTHALDPTRADVRIRLPATAEPGLELRGRLMGPRCRFANTIEVAYPLRRVGSTAEYSVVIPEPQLWDPISPFLYEGPVEVWHGDELRQKTQVRRCFRELKLTSKGVSINGQPLVLKGIQFPPSPQVRYSEPARVEQEATLLDLRRQGFNSLLVDSIPADLPEWADRLGFLIVTSSPAAPNSRASLHLDGQTLDLPAISRSADGAFAFPCLDS